MLFNVFLGSLGLMFGPLGGALGGTFGGLGAFRWIPEILKLLFLHPGAPKLPPEGASTAPNSAPSALVVKQKAPISHHGPHFGTEADPSILKNHAFANDFNTF